MTRDSIGVIFGKTGTHEFKFAIPNTNLVKRTDYIKVWHESDGWILAQVVSMTSSSDDFNLESAANAASGGNVKIPHNKFEAEALIIGFRDREGLLRVPRTPFSSGDKVFPADHDMIRSILGLSNGNIFIGLLEGHDIKVSLDMNNLIQKHCSILAKTGSGKSYTAGVILEEILELVRTQTRGKKNYFNKDYLDFPNSKLASEDDLIKRERFLESLMSVLEAKKKDVSQDEKIDNK